MRRTRKQKAAELVRLLENGPSLNHVRNDRFTPGEAETQTRLWLDTWVKPLVEDLVPELRRKP